MLQLDTRHLSNLIGITIIADDKVVQKLELGELDPEIPGWNSGTSLGSYFFYLSGCSEECSGVTFG